MIERLLADRQELQAFAAAQRKEDERHAASPAGMRETASYLRRTADSMLDSNDRETMVRLAVGYERRAEEGFKREKSSLTDSSSKSSVAANL
jgi:hypothetical protein